MSYQNLIQGTPGLKPAQDLSVNTLTCDNIVSTQTTFDSINTQTITVDLPATEIDFNSNCSFNEDVSIIGFLEADNVLINDLDTSTISVNTISKLDNTYIKLDDRTVCTNPMKITRINNTNIDTSVDLHIQSSASTSIWLQADTDNTGFDKPTILFTGTAGGQGAKIDLVNDTILKLEAGKTANSTSGQIDFYSAQAVNNGENKPTFINETRFGTFKMSGSTLSTDLNLDTHTLSGVTTLGTSTLNVSNQTNTVNEILTGKMKLTNIVGDTTLTPSASILQIRANGINQPSILIESDTTDIIPANGGVITMQNDAGNDVFEIFQSTTGEVFQTSSNGFQFSTCTVSVPKVNDISTIGVYNAKFLISSLKNTSLQNLDMSTNNINNVGTLTSNNLTLSTLSNTLTSSQYLVRNAGTNVIEYRNPLYVGYLESLGLSTSTDTVNYVNKITFTDTFPAGIYVINLYASVGNSNGDRITYLQIREDLNTIETDLAKPKVDIVNGKVTMNMMYIRTLTAGSHTFYLDYKPQANTGRIENTVIVVRQLS